MRRWQRLCDDALGFASRCGALDIQGSDAGNVDPSWSALTSFAECNTQISDVVSMLCSRHKINKPPQLKEAWSTHDHDQSTPISLSKLPDSLFNLRGPLHPHHSPKMILPGAATYI